MPLLRPALIALGLLAATHVAAEPFRFIALGDMPYGAPEAVYGPYRAMIETVNARSPDFVLHLGDTKSGRTPCDDDLLATQLSFLNLFEPALIYTPGDNEWADCHASWAGGYDPVERLNHIRRTYFADPGHSLGTNPISVENQATAMADTYGNYVENTRFFHKNVAFVQLHVVGSNNNLRSTSSSAVREYRARNAANLSWLQDTFARARSQKARAVVVAFHGDIFGKGAWWTRLRFWEPNGHRKVREALERHASAFGGPVLLIYGDGHEFHLMRPFKYAAPDTYALQVFGAPFMHGVEVTVDLDEPAPFAVRPVLNPAQPAVR